MLPPRRKVESGPHSFLPPHTGPSGMQPEEGRTDLTPLSLKKLLRDAQYLSLAQHLKIITRKNSINPRTESTSLG